MHIADFEIHAVSCIKVNLGIYESFRRTLENIAKHFSRFAVYFQYPLRTYFQSYFKISLAQILRI